jgi:xylulose-5-phosphate/fructose-6-phosphate phosphoketolase
MKTEMPTAELFHGTADANDDRDSTGSDTLAPELLPKIHAYWRAANHLSVGQIYLYDNPLLKAPLQLSHVKPLLLSHWGTTPGQNFIYVHLNRVIQKYDLNMFYVAWPGSSGRLSWMC